MSLNTKQYIMKTISISKRTREEIKHLSKYGETVGDTLSRLLQSIDKDTCELKGRTNISINEDIYELLKTKQGSNESFNATIERAIRSHKLNGNND